MIWCNTHQRRAWICKIRGGITLPCQTVDITNLVEIKDDIVKATITVDFGEQGFTFEVDILPEALEDIRHNFNPAGLESVNRLKTLAALFLSENYKQSAAKPESGRDFAHSRTLMRDASMNAVLGATKGLR